MLWLGIVILLLANIVMVFLILAKGGGWPPFRDNKPDNGGIDLNENVNINFDEFANNNLTFILIKAGGGDIGIHDNIYGLISAAKSKDADIGIYWKITDDFDIESQVSEVVKIVNEVKTRGLPLNLGFYYKFEGENSFLKDINKMNDYCGRIQNFDCGISLNRTYYDNNYKAHTGNLKNIKNYWINSDELETTWENEDPVKMYNVMGTITFGEYTFSKLKRK